MKISKDLVEQIFAQGRREAPNEACGYLAGHEGTVVKAVALSNADHSPEHFSLDPKEQFAAVRQLRGEGLTLLAVYHTHPATPARPSAEDIRLAYDPGLLYVIASLQPGAPDLRAFRIHQGQVTNEPLAVEDRTMPAYRIPASYSREIDELETLVGRFRSGTVTEVELKARRVPFGVYEQRTKGRFMIRIRCAAGIVTPGQLRRIAELASRFASGRLHLTTRQEMQMHDVPLENIVPVIRELYGVGLATRGGGGNTVRNIVASWDSGIAGDEVFDVTPHAVELTSRLIALGDSWLLPRKFKIAFSNSEADNAFATAHDVGFIAATEGSRRGFRVFVAGGMGRSPQPGQLLHEFIGEEEVFLVAEAVKRLFSRLGNRRNKHSARLRFLWNTLGRERFLEEYHRQRALLEAEHPAPFTPPAGSETAQLPSELAAANETSTEFDLWKKRYVTAQRQNGLFSVLVPLPLGDLSSDKATLLADGLAPFGDNVLRCTVDQNLSLRHIPGPYLGNLFALVRRVSPCWSSPRLLVQAVACAGASTCQLGICPSRGALSATLDRLKTSDLDLDNLSDFRLHFSGCLNSCGRHGLAHLGFLGKVGHKGGHSYPAYTIVAGAQIDAVHGSTLAHKIDDISARHVPDFIVDFLRHYAARKDAYSDFQQYLQGEGAQCIRALCNRYRHVPAIEEDETYYRDWGAAEPFSLAGRGTGECAAGLFDLIDVDLAKVRADRAALAAARDPAARTRLLQRIVVTAAHALLVTRGVEGATDREVLDLFERHFLDTGIVAESSRPVIEAARGHVGWASAHADGSRVDGQEQHGLKPSLPVLGDQALAFAQEIEDLYAAMDDTLQFPPHVPAPRGESEIREPVKIDLIKDLRGVACPMNFVKTKMALSQLQAGQVLQVLLDDGEPVENVPRSVAAEGHCVLEQAQAADHWSVTIRKA